MITALTTGAISLAILGWTGYAFPVYRQYQISPRFHVYVYFADGLVRLYGLRASDEITLEPEDAGVRVFVRRVEDGTICHGIRHTYPWALRPYALYWDRWSPRQVAPAVNLHFIGVRSWLWLPVTPMAIYPFGVVVRNRYDYYFRRHRHNRGLCLACGYNLTGLPEPRCPECGTKIGSMCHECGYNLTGNVSGVCPECGTTVGRPVPDAVSA